MCLSKKVWLEHCAFLVVVAWCNVSESEGKSDVVEVEVVMCCGWKLVSVMKLCGSFH